MELMRESIFVSAVRSFCRSFFSLCGIFLALVFGAVLYGIVASPYEPEERTEMKILPDLQGNRTLVSATAPVVLHIDIAGMIGEPGKLDTEVVTNILLDSQAGPFRGERVKAILLRLDTPGGTVTDSDNIYRMLKKYKEKYKVPVYAYVEGLCASGGMYIACAADVIYASPSSVVGSVGVLAGPFFNVSDTLTRYGVQAKLLTEGTDKADLNPFEPWKPGEADVIQAILASAYERFMSIVSGARPNLTRDKLLNVYGARIYDAATAQQYGYIDNCDADGDSVLAALLEAAKIDPSKPYQVVQLVPKHTLLTALMQGEASSIVRRAACSVLGLPSFEIQEPCAYLYKP